MATTDRFAEAEHSGRLLRARTLNLAVLADATAWFAAAAAGMVVVFVGLGVDAYRHKHNAAEEALLSLSNPGHLLAAIGLAITSASVLIGLTVSALRTAETKGETVRRFVPVTAAWVALATIAAASVTYVAASGVTLGHSHGGGTSAVASASHNHGAATADDAGGVARALQSQGITGTDPSKVPGALTQGADGHGGHVHDRGKQPTFDQIEALSDEQLLPLFPPGTMTLADIPKLRKQLGEVRQVALKYQTPAAAAAGGYVRTTSDVPFMGEHYLNFSVLRGGVFDPGKPSGLLFSKIDGGEEKLVGVWYLMLPGIGGVTRDQQPENTWAGNLALWHAHEGLCLVGLSSASEGETREGCAAKGGSFTPDLRWMMHVWVAPAMDNPDGVFAYLNSALYAKQVAAQQQSGAPQSGTISAR